MWAKRDPLDRLVRFDGRIKIGKELELTDRPLSSIIDYFDLSDFKAEDLTEEDLRDYVQDPEAFQALPAEVRAELTRGIDLRSPRIIPGRVDLPAVFRGVAGKAGQAPGSSVHQAFRRKGDYSGPTGWELVNAVWNALPLERKRQIVRIDLLGRMARAALARRYPDSLKLREDAPEFMRRLKWHATGNALEIKDENPSVSAVEFYRRLEALAGKAGVWTGIHLPHLATRWDSALHYHVSVQRPNVDLEPLAKELSRWLAIRAAARGNVDPIYSSGLNTYNSGEVQTRGSLVRQVYANRLEFRFGGGVLEEDLEYYLRHMTARNQEKAARAVRADADRLLTPFTALRILASPLDVAKELLRGTPYMDLHKAIENADRLPLADYERRLEAELERAGASTKGIDVDAYWLHRGRLRSPEAMDAPHRHRTVRILLDGLRDGRQREDRHDLLDLIHAHPEVGLDPAVDAYVRLLAMGSRHEINWLAVLLKHDLRVGPEAIQLLLGRLGEHRGESMGNDAGVDPIDIIYSLREALADMVSRHPEIIPDLLRLLEHASPRIRDAAAYVLGYSKTSRTEVEEALRRRVIEDGNHEIRKSAIAALWLLQSKDRRTAEVLLDSFRDNPEGWDRVGLYEAFDVLAKALAGHEDLIARLRSMTADADDRVRYSAVQTLGRLRPAEEASVQALLDRLADESPEVRAAAASALADLGAREDGVITALLKQVREDPDVSGKSAAEALKRLTPDGEWVRDELIAMLRHPERSVWRSSASILGKIVDKSDMETVGRITALIDAGDSAGRLAALQTLAEIRPAQGPVTSMLIRALADPDPEAREAAALALAGVGPERRDAVATLVRAFQDPNPSVRKAAAMAIETIRPRSRRVMASLEVLVNDADVAVQYWALKAFRAVTK